MKREQVTLRIPEELKEALHREAQEKGLSFNGLVIQILQREAGRERLRSL